MNIPRQPAAKRRPNQLPAFCLFGTRVPPQAGRDRQGGRTQWDSIHLLRLAGCDAVGRQSPRTGVLAEVRVAEIPAGGFDFRIADLATLLEKAGIKVPHDIAVAGTTVLDMPIPAGIDQHSHEIGRVGFLALNSLINDGAFGIPRIFRQILVEGSWVDGSSLPDRRKQSRRACRKAQG